MKPGPGRLLAQTITLTERGGPFGVAPLSSFLHVFAADYGHLLFPGYDGHRLPSQQPKTDPPSVVWPPVVLAYPRAAHPRRNLWPRRRPPYFHGVLRESRA